MSACKLFCGMLHAASVVMFTMVAFSGISWMLKTSLLESKLIPHLNLFGDVSLVPFMMMAVLYFFAYVVNGCYVEVARLFACERGTRTKSAGERSASASCTLRPANDFIYQMLEGIRGEFQARLVGFLMAYVAATIAKVAIQTRVVLAVLYTIAMIVWMFSQIFGISGLAQLSSCVAHVCCFKLFFYSFVPGYSLMTGNFANSFGKAVQNVQGIMSRLVRH